MLNDIAFAVGFGCAVGAAIYQLGKEGDLVETMHPPGFFCPHLRPPIRRTHIAFDGGGYARLLLALRVEGHNRCADRDPGDE